MTLEQAYKKVHMMDEVLDSDILNDEEYTSVAKRFNWNQIQDYKSDCKNRAVLINKQRSDDRANKHNAGNQKH